MVKHARDTTFDIWQPGSAYRLGGDMVEHAWDPTFDIRQPGSAHQRRGDGWGAKWRQFYRRSVDAMEGFGDRVGRVFGTTLQELADKKRLQGYQELEASGRRKKRVYQRQQFMRIAR